MWRVWDMKVTFIDVWICVNLIPGHIQTDRHAHTHSSGELAQWLTVFNYLHSGSQPSIIPVSGDLMPSIGLCEHQTCISCTDRHTHRRNTHIHDIKFKKRESEWRKPKQIWWFLERILALERPRKEDDHEFEVSLSYIARLCLNIKKGRKKQRETDNKRRNKEIK